jgi:hypothetical protein
MERPTTERLAEIRAELEVTQSLFFEFDAVEELFAEIDALTAECEKLQAASEINFAATKRRERDALRRGFGAGQALDEQGNAKYPDWKAYEQYLADEAEYAATLARIAEAEEGEKWPQDA